MTNRLKLLFLAQFLVIFLVVALYAATSTPIPVKIVRPLTQAPNHCKSGNCTGVLDGVTGELVDWVDR